MFLKRFIFINWGNVPATEFEFGPVNLFSGGNGSGKTTAADAIQTIMTAAHENLFQYNPGQDETTQRGRGGKKVRTLSSYVLGCDDGSYSRLDMTDGYLAAVFHPSKGENGEPFTAVIGIRAWLEQAGSSPVAKEELIQFFILPMAELEEKHFLLDIAGKKHVVALTDFHTQMVKAFGKRRIERYDGKKAYLRRLYGALRGKSESVPDVEAVAAARAFSRFMAYKPVKSIDRFVADEILEPKDLGDAIRSVSSQLKTIHGMERDAFQLKASIETLGRAEIQAQLYIENWIEINLLNYSIAQADYLRMQQDYLRGKAQQKEKQETLAETEKTFLTVGEELRSLNQRQINLEAQRRGIDTLRQKDELKDRDVELNQHLRTAVQTIMEEDKILTANIATTRDMMRLLTSPEIAQSFPEITEREGRAMAQAVLDAEKQMLVEIHHLLQRDAINVTHAIEDRMDDFRQAQRANARWHQFWFDKIADGSRRDRLAGLAHERRSRYNTLKNQLTEKEREITRLDADQVSYPDYVERALTAIRQQCPKADPRVLCDHVEVKDARWQMAIEGYLGGARFSIIVSEEYEAEAIRIVRNLPGKTNKARVIQGKKAREDAARLTLDENSVVHVLEFSHAVAKAYLTASYGTVLRVNSAEELRTTRRGITADGMASGNYSMWRCDVADSELVFGAGARERALAAKREEFEALQTQWHAANDQMQQVASLLNAVDTLKNSGYADAFENVLAINRKIEETAALIAQLDLSEHEELEKELVALQERHDALEAKKSELSTNKGKIQAELGHLEKQIKAVADQQDVNQEKVDECESALRRVGAVWTDLDVEARLEHADNEAKTLNVNTAKNAHEELEKNLRGAERKLAEEIRIHNQQCRPADTVVYDESLGEYDDALFKRICAVRHELDRVRNLLKNNILVEKHSDLEKLKDSFNNAFVSNLCHSIFQALSEGKRKIELLNKELQHHRFGADRETFRFDSEWVPEYRDYARFFEEVIKNPGIGDDVTLFDASLSQKSSRVRDDLMEMLLDREEDRAMRELERIADYRNYRRYEIYKEVEGKEPIPLSEYGTGSGGQLETPAYIIRAAAITSAFRFNEGKSHLRTVLVDEAFSKMDETRSREVIRYLTESLGLQLVFIMPTSKCGPFMDLVTNEFVFAKVPSEKPRGQLTTRVLVDRKEYNQEKIRELWETHKRSIYQQAQLDFMEEFAGEQSA